MNSGPLVFLGLFFALVSSWCGFILAPQFSLGNQQPAVIEEFTGKTYPPVRPGLARQGKEIYQANGCAYCHTQQVRGGPEDIDRWGKRLR